MYTAKSGINLVWNVLPSPRWLIRSFGCNNSAVGTTEVKISGNVFKAFVRLNLINFFLYTFLVFKFANMRILNM